MVQEWLRTTVEPVTTLKRLARIVLQSKISDLFDFKEVMWLRDPKI